ncbi:MAG: UDP-3-O-(3-hydroxymyristoyl)glucosamine N-acyltransferase [Bdellovibrionales bacterium]|nr:UDP-3-O-(3-hydroxymyristoyl)glucosamine N-acyltransferase [Bdellovibrionales bacterium]
MLYIARNTPVSLEQVVATLGGDLCGSGVPEVEGICSLDEQRRGCVAFSTLSGAHAVQEVLNSLTASVLIIRNTISPADLQTTVPLIRVPDPLPAIVKLIPLFYEELAPARSISEKADIDPTAKLGQNVHIGAFCSVGAHVVIEDGAVLYPGCIVYPHAVIGANALLHSGAVIRERCVVGAGCVVQNGAVVGADGFGYMSTPQGLASVPQVGTTVLEEQVDIGANSCVDRGTLGTTRIGRNTKLDNLVQLGHNVHVGRNSILCGDVAVGGSTKIGDGVVLGGAVSIADHVTIDDGVRFGGRSAAGHINHYTQGDWAGYPALPAAEWLRIQGTMRKLPDLRRRLARLERKLETQEGERE